MSLVVAVPFGIASAVVYGTSIVVQHHTAAHHANDGEASASGLIRMARDPLFLMAILGDAVGFALQIIALATGPVVVVQPLVVLMLPVSLLVSAIWKRTRPQRGDLLGVLGVLGGLTVFLALIGRPGSGRPPHSSEVGLAIILVAFVGGVLALAVTKRDRVVRGAMYGLVAGLYFGTLAVLVDAGSDLAAHRGLAALADSRRGLLLIAGIALLGLGGIILTQLSFQVGALGATLPANLAADPVAGVLLGALLLREHIPLSAGHLFAYGACLAVILAGAIRLANPHEDTEGPLTPADDTGASSDARAPAAAVAEPSRDAPAGS